MSSADWKETLAKVKISSEETGFHEDEFLSLEDLVTVKKEALERSLRRILSDLEELFRENRWEDALVVVYPLEEKLPEMEDRARQRVVKALKSYGERVQKSVFECPHLTEEKFLKMKNRLEDLIDSGEDTVRYYPLCRGCIKNVEFSGIGSPPAQEKFLVV